MKGRIYPVSTTLVVASKGIVGIWYNELATEFYSGSVWNSTNWANAKTRHCVQEHASRRELRRTPVTAEELEGKVVITTTYGIQEGHCMTGPNKHFRMSVAFLYHHRCPWLWDRATSRRTLP
jgi:hypothetical protein